jgi:hypothetical protein
MINSDIVTENIQKDSVRIQVRYSPSQRHRIISQVEEPTKMFLFEERFFCQNLESIIFTEMGLAR